MACAVCHSIKVRAGARLHVQQHSWPVVPQGDEKGPVICAVRGPLEELDGRLGEFRLTVILLASNDSAPLDSLAS